MAGLILITLALIPVAAWLGAKRAKWASLLALWPAALALWFGRAFHSTLAGQTVEDSIRWIPSIGLDLSFRMDGLAGIFSLLITVIGTGIVVYGANYFDGHPYSGRFQASLFLFMAAMLGVVLTDNILALFVFWELTGFASFLLIGFEHEKADARRSALQALIVTGVGGLALLAAAVLLSQITGTVSIREIIAKGELIRGHAAYSAIVLLVLLAAFTKSAQFPFQFWLPDAMAAPTPVSAYLHSATMVKAGIYLVARTTPALGGSELWLTLVVTCGGLTMLGGAFRAVQETDLKRVLAFSTTSALGAIMLLLGLGTEATLTAALIYLVAHACYKGTLFLVAGIIDHETGTRDIRQLSGLRKLLPFTAVAGALAAASMAGLPLLLGFLAKEQAYEAALHHPDLSFVAVGVLVVASAFLGVCGLMVGWLPFSGKPTEALAKVHEAGPGLWLPPMVLGVTGLVLGAVPSLSSGAFSLAASNIIGAPHSVKLALWHGFNIPLGLSALTLLLTLGIYQVVRAERWPAQITRWSKTGTSHLYTGFLAGIDRISQRIAPPLQNASLASYALTFVVTSSALVGTALLLSAQRQVDFKPLELRIHEVLVAIMIISGAVSAARAKTTMVAVLSLGTAGYGVALMFLLYGAPDLAMTQFAVETLTAVIFVFIFWKFPRMDRVTTRLVTIRDAIISIGFGGLMMSLALKTAAAPTSTKLSAYFTENAPAIAHGRNIVNVILVDFRALDTLGEITVLVTAAVGVRALLRIAAAERQGG